MSDSALGISVETLKRVDLVTVSGRIDSDSAPGFDQALKDIMENGRYNIVLNMSSVEYMSSAGLRAIVTALRTSKKKRGRISLADPSERVSEVLELSGLNSMFDIYDDVTTAVGSY